MNFLSMKLLGREYVLHGNISYSGTPGGWVQGSRVLSNISRHIYVPIIGVNGTSVFHQSVFFSTVLPLKNSGEFQNSRDFFRKGLWVWRTFPLILVQTLGRFSKIFNHYKSSRRSRTSST